MTTLTKAQPKTSTLQMVRAEINLREFNRWMGSKRLQDPDHAMHCLLKECFGKLAPKPFRLIAPRGDTRGYLYGYSAFGADALRDAADIYACPLQSRILPVHCLDSKTMPQSWRKGLELGFEVRIRPVVRLMKDPSLRTRNPIHERLFKVRRLQGEGGPEVKPRRGKECDVFLWEAMRHPNKGEFQGSREQVYSEWLSGQLARLGGASLDLERTKLISFQRTRAYRKRRGSRYSEGPDAVVRGVFTVTNSEAFTALLARGVGRHRAYGYGMLLLRPAGRTG